jgi:hypothetical protein
MNENANDADPCMASLMLGPRIRQGNCAQARKPFASLKGHPKAAMKVTLKPANENEAWRR